jgi:hypothetical protein
MVSAPFIWHRCRYDRAVHPLMQAQFRVQKSAATSASLTQRHSRTKIDPINCLFKFPQSLNIFYRLVINKVSKAAARKYIAVRFEGPPILS